MPERFPGRHTWANNKIMCSLNAEQKTLVCPCHDLRVHAGQPRNGSLDFSSKTVWKNAPQGLPPHGDYNHPPLGRSDLHKHPYLLGHARSPHTINHPPLRSDTPPHNSLLRCGVVVCPPTRLGSVPFGPVWMLTSGAFPAYETCACSVPCRCLSPCRPGASTRAAKGSVRRVPAGWRRRLLVPRRRCYATVRQVPPQRCCGWCVGCVPRSYLRSVLRTRPDHADDTSGGALTRGRAPRFSRRKSAVDGTRWGLRPRPHRQVVRGRRSHKNLVRRDTVV